MGGETVQFAEATGPDQIGVGVAMAEEAFDLVEPHLSGVAPDWTPAHRYGVYTVSPEARKAMAESMRTRAEELEGCPNGTCLKASPLGWKRAWISERQSTSLASKSAFHPLRTCAPIAIIGEWLVNATAHWARC